MKRHCPHCFQHSLWRGRNPQLGNKPIWRCYNRACGWMLMRVK